MVACVTYHHVATIMTMRKSTVRSLNNINSYNFSHKLRQKINNLGTMNTNILCFFAFSTSQPPKISIMYMDMSICTKRKIFTKIKSVMSAI